MRSINTCGTNTLEGDVCKSTSVVAACSVRFKEWHAREECKLKLMSESLTAEHTARIVAMAAAGRETLAKASLEKTHSQGTRYSSTIFTVAPMN
eukprot:2079607-Amphidinium_carterae.1